MPRQLGKPSDPLHQIPKKRKRLLLRKPRLAFLRFGLCAVAELNWSLVQIELIHSVFIIRKRKLHSKSNLFFFSQTRGRKMKHTFSSSFLTWFEPTGAWMTRRVPGSRPAASAQRPPPSGALKAQASRQVPLHVPPPLHSLDEKPVSRTKTKAHIIIPRETAAASACCRASLRKRLLLSPCLRPEA